jgi:lipid-A-disaccharide synthase-like uncharacterized protein
MFWYLSIGGALMLLTYAIHRRDLVFIFGQSSGLLIYFRNLQLLRMENHRRCAIRSESTADRSPDHG